MKWIAFYLGLSAITIANGLTQIVRPGEPALSRAGWVAVAVVGAPVIGAYCSISDCRNGRP